MILTERENLWVWGRSLERYSKPLNETGGAFVRTNTGSKVFQYKYDLNTPDEDKRDIANYFAHQVIKVIKNEIYTFYPTPPFDVCVGVPPNRTVSSSLPSHICAELAGHYQWISNGFSAIKKTRHGEVIKFKNPDERANSVKGLFRVEKTEMPKPKKGFLVIDDVYATGSTMKELCRTLKSEYPETPIFMIVLANLTITEKYLR